MVDIRRQTQSFMLKMTKEGGGMLLLLVLLVSRVKLTILTILTWSHPRFYPYF